jgi:hypothetical protein
MLTKNKDHQYVKWQYFVFDITTRLQAMHNWKNAIKISLVYELADVSGIQSPHKCFTLG